MPRVHHVKKARKANRNLGIKKGQEYWWWKNRLPGRAAGVKRVSLTRPTLAQTTGNPFTRSLLEFSERLAGLNEDMEADEIKETINSVAEEVRSLAEEQQEKFDNMPDGLQQGPTGELLEERREALEAYADALENIDVDEDDKQAAIDEAQGEDVGL
jgi:hypothetical protein